MKNEMAEIAVKLIDTKNTNPRKDTKADLELIESVKTNGVKIPPIIAKCKDGTYILVAGARRLNAAKAAGLEKVTCMIVEGTEQELFEYMLLENAHRKSLTILEQATGVEMLVKLHGNKIESIAGKLNMTIPEVCRVLLITKLIPDIKKELSNVESTFSKIGIHALALIAGLPKAQQERLRSDYNIPIEVKELKEYIQNHYRFDLSNAKWNLDDDALARQPACVSCKKQSGNIQQKLFEEDINSKKGICGDPDCWKLKLTHYLTNCINDQKKIDPKTLVLDRTGTIGNEYCDYLDVSKYKKDSAGTINVLDINRDGVICKYKVSPLNGSKVQKERTVKQKTLKDRHEQLKGLRIGIVLTALAEYIKTKDADEFVLKNRSQNELTALSVIHRQGICCFAKNDKTVELLCDLVLGHEVKFNIGYGEKKQSGKLADVLWHITKEDVISSLGYSNSESCIRKDEWGQFVAKYIGFDWKKELEKAVIEKPEPKGWANLNADGTKKEVIKEPKKSRVADCDKCTKPHTKDCATCSATTGVPRKKVKKESKLTGGEFKAV